MRATWRRLRIGAASAVVAAIAACGGEREEVTAFVIDWRDRRGVITESVRVPGDVRRVVIGDVRLSDERWTCFSVVWDGEPPEPPPPGHAVEPLLRGVRARYAAAPGEVRLELQIMDGACRNGRASVLASAERYPFFANSPMWSAGAVVWS